VPNSYDFLSEDDEYQLNSITKFLFNKYGYESYFNNDDLPEDLKKDRCLALTSEVTKVKGSLLKTKLLITLKDCFGAVIMTSKIGESRLKKYDRAYNEALRSAFETFQTFDYNYVENEHEEATTKKTVIVTETPKTEIVEKVEEKKEATITMVAAKKKEKKKVLISENKPNQKYYAQEISNGYQLVNSEPRIVMVLLTTGAENIFLVKDKNAIVYKEDGFWYYSENNEKLSEPESIDIKF
jgi:hypothetical protein